MCDNGPKTYLVLKMLPPDLCVSKKLFLAYTFLAHLEFLSDINFRIGRDEMLTIVGTVGSGKSAVLKALLGEMVKVIQRHFFLGAWKRL